MANLGKVASLIVIVVLAVSGFVVLAAPAFATVTKPSVPEFTLKYVVSGYDVATTYKIDPYNGQKVVDQPGYHVNNSSIVVTIKNQPFDEHYNGLNYHLFFNVRYKGHFSQEWITKYSYGNFTLENINPKNWYPHPILEQKKSSEYTTAYYLATDYPTDAQLDFQVEAVLNYEGQIRVHSDWLDFTGFMIDGYIFDQESGWSDTQTINLADGASVISPTSTPFQILPTPTVAVLPSGSPTTILAQQNAQSDVLFGLSWEQVGLTVLSLVVVCLAVGLVVLWRRVAAKS